MSKYSTRFLTRAFVTIIVVSERFFLVCPRKSFSMLRYNITSLQFAVTWAVLRVRKPSKRPTISKVSLPYLLRYKHFDFNHFVSWKSSLNKVLCLVEYPGSGKSQQLVLLIQVNKKISFFLKHKSIIISALIMSLAILTQSYLITYNHSTQISFLYLHVTC
jgi:hypothetical protein